MFLGEINTYKFIAFVKMLYGDRSIVFYANRIFWGKDLIIMVV